MVFLDGVGGGWSADGSAGAACLMEGWAGRRVSASAGECYTAARGESSRLPTVAALASGHARHKRP